MPGPLSAVSRWYVRMVKLVVWDLDGTIVDTEGICFEAATDVLARYGKELPLNLEEFARGRRPIEIYAHLVETLSIPESPTKLLELSDSILAQKSHHAEIPRDVTFGRGDRFLSAPLLPGVLRLMEYFRRMAMPQCLATSTDRSNIGMKLRGHEKILEFFAAQIGGDEVSRGKPDPEIFLLAASRMDTAPSDCLVFEDSPAGAKAARLAGMRVVLVPSSHQTWANDVHSDQIEVLKSLMDFNPTTYAMPPFTDTLYGVVYMNPIIFLKGTVVHGFGRGARELGIRTANIDDASLAVTLSAAVTGIYTGWASVGEDQTVYKMVMSIGWNPFYKNAKKTAEAWLLHEFPEDFYDAELRLLVVGYLRPEADFTTVENLKAQIRQDAAVAERFLSAPTCEAVRHDPRLAPDIPPP